MDFTAAKQYLSERGALVGVTDSGAFLVRHPGELKTRVACLTDGEFLLTDLEPEGGEAAPVQDRLTDAERRLLTLLNEAERLFSTLPQQHPGDGAFYDAIHAARRIVMARPVDRVEGWVQAAPELTDLLQLLAEKKP